MEYANNDVDTSRYQIIVATRTRRYRMNALSLYRPVGIQEALDDFDRLMASFFGESPLTPAGNGGLYKIPAIDIRETDNAYILDVELPGYDEKAVEVTVEGRILTIQSKEEKPKEESKDAFVVRERRHSSFKRSLTLPQDADTTSTTGNFKNGLLSLEIHKLPEAKRRTVKIEAK